MARWTPLAVVAVMLAGAGVAYACDEPDLAISPGSTHAGDPVDFTVNNINPGATYEIQVVDGASATTVVPETANSGSGESASGTFTMPDLGGSSRGVWIRALVRHFDPPPGHAGGCDAAECQSSNELQYLVETEPVDDPDTDPVPDPGFGGGGSTSEPDRQPGRVGATAGGDAGVAPRGSGEGGSAAHGGAGTASATPISLTAIAAASEATAETVRSRSAALGIRRPPAKDGDEEDAGIGDALPFFHVLPSLEGFTSGSSDVGPFKLPNLSLALFGLAFLAGVCGVGALIYAARRLSLPAGPMTVEVGEALEPDTLEAELQKMVAEEGVRHLLPDRDREPVG